MASSSQNYDLSSITREIKQQKIAQSEFKSDIWSSLIAEINSAVNTLCELDNDETKYMDIIEEHTERIRKTMPSELKDIWYPKPFH